jgi:hypothetical protein
MAIEMLTELCGQDGQRWDSATEAALLALSARRKGSPNPAHQTYVQVRTPIRDRLLG